MPSAKTVIAVALLVSGCRPGPRAKSPDLDTILLLSIDTLRADHLGTYGDRNAETPNIDALGRESLVFEAAWSPVPLTLPSHATMLTGLYPPRHGVRANGVHRLPEDVPVLQAAFRHAGFATGAFIGGYPLHRRFGLARGFDHYDDDLPTRPDGFHYPERRAGEVVDRALVWLRAQGPNRKVFLFVHFYDPHAEYAPPPPFSERFASRPYDGEVAYVDSNVARLQAGLAAEARWERAVVLLLADHGESLGEHGEDTHGLLLYEGALHIPFLLKAPGLAPGRAREPVSLVDIAPTVLALARLAPFKDTDGLNITRPRDPGRDLYAETLAPYLDHGWSGLRALRRGTLKLLDGPAPELFDIVRDPGERRNLWPSPEGERLRVLLSSMGARLGQRAPLGSKLDPQASQALASLGYAGSSGPIPEDFGAARPDPRSRIEIARELDSISSLAPPSSPDALRRLRALAARAPEDNLIQRRIAATCVAAKDYEGAIRAYGEARRLGYAGEDLAEALGEALVRAGEARAERGDLEKARALMAEAARLAPGRANIQHAVGVVEARAGRTDEALVAFRRATQLDSNFAAAWFSAGLALERLGRKEEAQESYGRFLVLHPGNSPERDHAQEFVSR